MRCFKTTKDTHLAQYLLSNVEDEQNMRLRGVITKEGYVKLSVIMQYYGGEELRKAYPKADIERILTILVNAGLLKEQDTTHVEPKQVA